MEDETSDALAKARAAFKPVFDEQRETWAREGPTVQARSDGLGIKIDEFGGNCPVQAEGSFDSQRFYFRARYDEWQFYAWTGDRGYMATPNPDKWVIEREYGEGTLDAGWMPQHIALGFICDSVEEYRAREPVA